MSEQIALKTKKKKRKYKRSIGMPVIIAFFIGLYSDSRRELDKSLDKKKMYGMIYDRSCKFLNSF